MRHDPAVNATRGAVRAALSAGLASGSLQVGDLLHVAVSGGADSLALAAATAHEAPRLGLRCGAVTVDHGVQAGSAAQADSVAATCRALGLDPVSVERVDVTGDGGPEAAARAARYAALAAAAQRHGAAATLLGHTLDDQAETVLLGLARGSGARSLAGMAPAAADYLRPFLALRRATTVAACTALDLRPWHDPHNSDPAFTRVRVRDGALPALEAALGPGTPEALARTADLLRDDADALDGWAERELTALLADAADPAAPPDLPVRALAGLPVSIRRRVIRQAALQAGAVAGALSSGHVRELDRLVTDWHGQGPVALPGGLVGFRRCDRLTFR